MKPLQKLGLRKKDRFFIPTIKREEEELLGKRQKIEK